MTIGWRFATPAGTAVGPPREPLGALRAGDLGDELAFLWDIHAGQSGPGEASSSGAEVARAHPADLYRMSKRTVRRAQPRGDRCAVPYNRGMALTVRDIVTIPGMPLRLLAGDEARHAPGPLGAQLRARGPHRVAEGGRADPDHRHGGRRHGRRSSARTCAAWSTRASRALGSGSASATTRRRKAMITEATKHAFPLFEVPYPVPFIAITEAVFTRLLAEQYDTLQRAVDAEHVLTRAVLDGARRRRHRRVARERRQGVGVAARSARAAARDRGRGRRVAARARLGRRSVLAPRGGGVLALDARRGPSRLGPAGRRAGAGRGVPRGRHARATHTAGPDRRGPRPQPVRDRAGEIARGRRGRAAPAGRLLRRAGPRRAAGDRGRPRAHALRVRTRRAGAGGRDRAGRRRPRPGPARAGGHRPLLAARGRLPGVGARGRDQRAPAGRRRPGPGRPRQGARPPRRRRAPRGRRRARGTGRCRPVGAARRATRCRCAGWRAGSTPGSSSSGPTGCC